MIFCGENWEVLRGILENGGIYKGRLKLNHAVFTGESPASGDAEQRRKRSVSGDAGQRRGLTSLVFEQSFLIKAFSQNLFLNECH